MTTGQPAEIRAHFSGIRETIIAEISASSLSITAAVAWLTDPEIVESLIAAARRRVLVQIAILDDHSNNRGAASFERLKALGGKVFWIPTSERRAGSLHHKFCVLDKNVVITGSFNWTKTASTADENIVVVREDHSLVRGFEDAFRMLLDKHGHDAPTERLDNTDLVRRLSVVSSLITLADEEAIQAQARRLERITSVQGLAELIAALETQNWPEAQSQIEHITARLTALIVFEEPGVVLLRLEAMMLETELVGISIECAEIEQQIFEYDRQHSALVGDAVSEYLRLRAELAKVVAEKEQNEPNQRAEAEAKAAHEKYEKSLAEAEPPTSQLTEDEQRELKKLWRVAGMRWHPDRVSPDHVAAATSLFFQACEAEKMGDLDAMRRLIAENDQKPRFGEKNRSLSAKAGLEKEVERLARLVAEMARKVAELRISGTYQTILKLQDWGAHFSTLRGQLEVECADLLKKLGRAKKAGAGKA